MLVRSHPRASFWSDMAYEKVMLSLSFYVFLIVDVVARKVLQKFLQNRRLSNEKVRL